MSPWTLKFFGVVSETTDMNVLKPAYLIYKNEAPAYTCSYHKVTHTYANGDTDGQGCNANLDQPGQCAHHPKVKKSKALSLPWDNYKG